MSTLSDRTLELAVVALHWGAGELRRNFARTSDPNMKRAAEGQEFARDEIKAFIAAKELQRERSGCA